MQDKKARREYNHKYFSSPDNKKKRREWERLYEQRPDVRKKRLARKKRYTQTPMGLYLRYKDSAKTRNIEWKLTFDEFMSFWQQPCYYTGLPIETIGLDRIDSSKGYVIENLVSCCAWANMAKLDYSKDAFIEFCTKVAGRFTKVGPTGGVTHG